MSLCISGILSAPTFQKSEGISWSPQEGPSILRNPPFSESLRAQGFSKKVIAKGLGLPGIGKGEGTVLKGQQKQASLLQVPWMGPGEAEETQTGGWSRDAAGSGSLERTPMRLCHGPCHLSEICQGSIHPPC